MSDFAALVKRAHDLCRAVAGRDLNSLPLYIVLQSAIASEFGHAEGCEGYTSPSLDLYLREVLAPSWQGRGPCLVVNDLLLADVPPDDRESAFQAVVLHELTHILERPALYRDRPEADAGCLKFEALAVAHQTACAEPECDVPLYAGHEASFIRMVLHLRHRAMQHGAYVAPSRLCAGHRYGLFYAERYVQALGDEPEQLARGPLRIICQLPPPTEFTQLWDADVRASHHTLSLKETA